MDLLTWTRKGKDSNIYYIYIYIYIYIDWYVTQKSKSGEFVGTFLLLLLLLNYYCCYCLCVCVLPLQTVCCCYDKKNRLLEHNTYLTLPYLTHLFYRTLTRSTGIHLRFINWFLERTIILEDKKKPVPLGTNFKLARELIGIDYSIQSNSASTVAALLRTFTLGGCCGGCYYPKSRGQTKQNISIFKEEVHFFTINTCLSCTNTKSIQEKRKKTKIKNYDPPPHGFHPIINNLLLLLHHHYQPFRNHHQKIPPKSLSRRNGNHSL